MPETNQPSTDVKTATTLETPSTYMMNPIDVTEQVEDEVKQENEQKDEIPYPADTDGNAEEKKEGAPKPPETPTDPDVPKTSETPAGSEKTKVETPRLNPHPHPRLSLLHLSSLPPRQNLRNNNILNPKTLRIAIRSVFCTLNII